MQKNTNDLLAELLKIVNIFLDNILNRPEISPEDLKKFRDEFTKYKEEERAKGKKISDEDIYYKLRHYFWQFEYIKAIFIKYKSGVARSYINILLDFRNEWAHKVTGSEPFSIDDVEYACKTALYLANAANDSETTLELESIFETLGELKSKKNEEIHPINESDSSSHVHTDGTDGFLASSYIAALEALAQIDLKNRPGILTEFIILLFRFFITKNSDHVLFLSKFGQYIENTNQFKDLEKAYLEIYQREDADHIKKYYTAVKTLIRLPKIQKTNTGEFETTMCRAVQGVIGFITLDDYAGTDDCAEYYLSECPDYLYTYEEIAEMINYLLDISFQELKDYLAKTEVDGYERIRALINMEISATDYKELFFDSRFTIQNSSSNEEETIICIYPGMDQLTPPNHLPEKGDLEKEWYQELRGNESITLKSKFLAEDEDGKQLSNNNIQRDQSLNSEQLKTRKIDHEILVERGRYSGTIHFSDGNTSFALGYGKIKLTLQYLPEINDFINGVLDNPELIEEYKGYPTIYLPSTNTKIVGFGRTKAKIIVAGLGNLLQILEEDKEITPSEIENIIKQIN